VHGENGEGRAEWQAHPRGIEMRLLR